MRDDTDPLSPYPPVIGQIYYDPRNEVRSVWSGHEWVPFDEGSVAWPPRPRRPDFAGPATFFTEQPALDPKPGDVWASVNGEDRWIWTGEAWAPLLSHYDGHRLYPAVEVFAALLLGLGLGVLAGVALAWMLHP